MVYSNKKEGSIMIMLLLTGLFYIVLFALGAGVVISVVIFVPLTIYVIPYCLWVDQDGACVHDTGAECRNGCGNGT